MVKVNKAVEEKRKALYEVLNGEPITLEFTVLMSQPSMAQGIQASRVSMRNVSKSSPGLCWITNTRLLIAYKNTHPASSKVRDFAKLLGEHMNIFIVGLEEIYDIQVGKFFKSETMTLTTRNSIFEFVSTVPRANEIIFFLKRNAPTEALPPPPPTSDVVDQIRKFGELRDQGLLTNEEFEAQKKKLLG